MAGQTNQIPTSEDGRLEQRIPTAAPPDDDPVGKAKGQSLRTVVAKEDRGQILGGDAKLEVDLEHGKGTELKRKPSSVIPRRKRRGLFAAVVIGISEIDDPVQYSKRIKGFILSIIAMAAIAGPLGFIPNPSSKYL